MRKMLVRFRLAPYPDIPHHLHLFRFSQPSFPFLFHPICPLLHLLSLLVSSPSAFVLCTVSYPCEVQAPS